MMSPMSPPWMTMTVAIVCATLFLHSSSATAPAHPKTDHQITSLPGQPAVKFHQFSGYITVDGNQDRALFYYLAEAQTDPASKPLVLWLNGGPGCSSVGVGAFVEHGPFKPSGAVLIQNEYSWNKEANMLYLESPAGVGFSYSANKSFYASVDDQMTARDNLVFLQNWLHQFPEYINRPFFIAGESYAGHYVPQLAQLIVGSRSLKLSLTGIAIGNPLLEFNTDFNSGPEFLWSHGVISDSTYEASNTLCNGSQLRRQAQEGSPTPVCSQVGKLISGERSNFIDGYGVLSDVCLSSAAALSQSLLLNNFLPTQKAAEINVCVEEETTKYMNRQDVQKTLHARLVGVSGWSACSSGALRYVMQNLEVPTIQILGTLVKSGIRVQVYSGDQDSVIPLLGTRKLVNSLANDLGLETTVPYRVWFEGKQVAGWTQVYGNVFSYTTIRGGSHEAPLTQPARSLVMFQAFLQGKMLNETGHL